MIIRIVLLALFFIYVVRAPMSYRASVMEAMAKDNPDVRLTKQESQCTREFQNALKLPVGDPRRLNAFTNLASARWGQLKYQDAENLYRLSIIETKPDTNYDQRLVDNMIHLAAVYRDQGKFAEARASYASALDYDQKHLTASDPRIGRDLSNMGLNYYIEASTKDRVDASSKNKKDERTTLMRQANNYFERALRVYGDKSENEQRASITLYNQYLVLRDLGEFERSKKCKAKADGLDSSFNRLCKLP